MPKKNLQQAIMYYFNYIERYLNNPDAWLEQATVTNGEVVLYSRNSLFGGDSSWDGTVASIMNETEGCYDFETGQYYYQCGGEQPVSKYMKNYWIDKDKRVEVTALYSRALNAMVKKGLLIKSKVRDTVYLGGEFGGVEMARTINAYSMVGSEHIPYNASRGDFSVHYGKYRHSKKTSIDCLLIATDATGHNKVRNRNALTVEYEPVE